MPVRDFDAALNEAAGERPAFIVGGEQFHLRARLPYSKWQKLLHLMRSDEVDNMDATRKFFDTVLVKEDRERFAELLEREESDHDDDADLIGIDQMDAMTDWAMEYFTGKLRRSSDGSSPGSNATTTSQNVVSLNPRTSAS